MLLLLDTIRLLLRLCVTLSLFFYTSWTLFSVGHSGLGWLQDACQAVPHVPCHGGPVAGAGDLQRSV